MEIRIYKWEAKNLRCPDHSIKFYDKNNELYQINLIQMPNGTGKTTTLNLIRMALSGSGQFLKPVQVKQFQSKNKEKNGFFNIMFKFDEKLISIKMTFDFNENKINYFTTVNKGEREGYNLPTDIKRFFDIEFVEFFVFDGELADRLLDSQYTDAEKAIKELFHLNLLEKVELKFEKYWENKIDNQSITSDRGLSRLKNRRKLLKDNIKEFKEKKNKIDKNIKDKKTKLEEYNKKFSEKLKANEELSNKINSEQKNLNEVKKEISDISRYLLEVIRNPFLLNNKMKEDLKSFKESLDKVKLPENTAKEFFHELSEEKVCICGRTIDDSIKKHIINVSKDYMGSQNISFLNNLKYEISENIDDYENIILDFNKNMNDLKMNFAKKIETENRIDNLKIMASKDPEINNIRIFIEKLNSEIGELENSKKKYIDSSESGNGDDSKCIDVLESILVEVEKRIKEATNTVFLKNKIDLISKVLKETVEKSSNMISEKIAEQTNELFSKLMPYNSIKIESIKKSIKLTGQESGSVGEVLSVAYAFLSVIFNNTQFNFPFIVDSPMNPIDIKVRRKVSDLIPKLSNQFIGFTISSEREGFVEVLEENKINVQYITMFKKDDKELFDLSSKYTDIKETSNSVIVPGIEFFKSVHIKEV